MKNILVIDDDELILFSLFAGLSAGVKDAKILTAHDGREAVAVLESLPVDLIMTDLTMPVMNGYEVVAYANGNHPGIPVCVMTGDCIPDVERRFPPGTVDRFVAKPFDISLLASDVSSLLDLGKPRHLAPA